ncbi:MAG TPA: molybdopterin-dependent oxidoreductase [Actinomycetota bacterium]|jgi:anaerobic selenocysteine-containing dehydrogenase
MAIAELPVRITRGACPHDCPDTCAWTVTVRDGRAVELKGDPEHPFTRGGLCAKVNHFLDDRTYNPDRLLHPLRRTGPKGSGEFEEVSWDEALDAIAERFGSIVAEHGGDAVLPFSYLGTQGLVQGEGMAAPFFARLGATRLERAVCGSAGGSGLEVTMGGGPGLLPEELVHSRYLVIWGSNTVSTNLHLWPFVLEARRAGAQIVVIDPIKTRTAAAADRHVRPLPGTDAALALGMMHVIVREDLHDPEYLERHTVGFDRLRERLKEYPPERAAEITGVSAEEIRELARGFATTRPAAIRVLVGLEHHERGAEMFRAIACLPALVGAWRERGGGLCHMTFQLFGELDWSCGAFVPEDRSIREVNMVQLGRALTSLDPPIRAMVVYNANPAATMPNQNLVLEGLRREDLFTVVLEHFLTDTARHADYVLPATTQVEHHDVLFSWGQTYLTFNEPAIAPVGDALSNAEIFRRLAGRMGFDEPAFALTDEELTDAAVAPLGATRVRELRDRGWIRMDGEDDVLPYAEGGFPTPSGKFELVSERLARIGGDALPGYVPAAESPAGNRPLAARFPLILLTAKGGHHFLNSSYANVDRALRAEKTPMLEIHGDDAAPRGIADGDVVRVFNDRGSVEMPARIGDRIRPGVVSMPSGWWASLSPGGSSANALTSDGLSDLGGGGDFHDALVQVELAG